MEAAGQNDESSKEELMLEENTKLKEGKISEDLNVNGTKMKDLKVEREIEDLEKDQVSRLAKIELDL